MDHADALRMNATERYLLNELDTTQLEQFEEHMFGCPECALDVQAASMFLEQSKNELAQPTPSPVPVSRPVPAAAPSPWFAWLRPAFGVPAMAVLLLAIGYQGYLLRGSQGSTPDILASATINVATRSAATPRVHTKAGQPFVLLLNIPTESRFSSYIADLYDPAGHIKWSLPISAEMASDTLPMRVPGLRESGLYVLAIRGISQDGSSPTEIGRQPFELSLQ
jgi:anti-sigma factor RsiW